MGNSKLVHGLILAAGKGSRMNSDLPKPLVELDGKPLLGYLLDGFEAVGLEGVSVVIGHQGELVEKYIGQRGTCHWQRERLGTAHAVECALRDLPSTAHSLLVFVGDSPLLSPATIQKLIDHHFAKGDSCSFLTATFTEHFPYARVITDEDGQLVKCVEERDASPEELKVREYLSSHFIFDLADLRRLLPKVRPHARTGERYLTDMIDLLLEEGGKVSFCPIEDYRELVGLNTPEDLQKAAHYRKTFRL